MKEKPVDYSATLIYKITCKDPTITDLYVGHTTNFVQRREQHKQCSVNTSSKLYNVIRNNGGWTNWTMEIVNFFNCKNLNEAKTKEQEYFVALNATLNSIEPMPNKKEQVIKINPIIIKTPQKKSTEPSPVNNKRFMCDKCNYSCNKESDFNKHLLTVKHNKIIEKLDEPNKCKCKCGKLYNFRQGLSFHKKTCIITKKICETSENNNHVAEISTKETEKKCQTPENNNHNLELLTKEIKDFNILVLDMLKNNTEIQKQILELLKNK